MALGGRSIGKRQFLSHAASQLGAAQPVRIPPGWTGRTDAAGSDRGGSVERAPRRARRARARRRGE
eukprot:scaffold229352_cov23-Tisochrysis_lutea.AAC.2